MEILKKKDMPIPNKFYPSIKIILKELELLSILKYIMTNVYFSDMFAIHIIQNNNAVYYLEKYIQINIH